MQCKLKPLGLPMWLKFVVPYQLFLDKSSWDLKYLKFDKSVES